MIIFYFERPIRVGLDRRGGMNQNTPNPGLALRWPHPCSLPIEWGSWGCPRMWTFDHGWYWTPRSGCRQGTEMGSAAILAELLWLTPEGSAWQRLWRGQRHHNRLRATSGGETRGYRQQSPPKPHAFSGIFACGSGGPLATEVGFWLI